MDDADEIYAGTPALMTMTFKDEVTGTLTDPSAGTLVIQKGYGANNDTTIDFASWVRTSVGVWTYTYDTTGVATAATGNIEHTVQVQTTAGIKSMSQPARFTVLPPVVGGLT